MIQIVQVGGGERVLVLGLAQAAAHADVLHRLKEQRDPFEPGQLAAQPVDDLVHADLALPEGFQRDEHASIVNGGIA